MADGVFGNVPPIRLARRSMEAATNIGMRPAQEDRVVVCPRMCNNSDKVSLCCVFDGTVGFEASEFCQQNIVRNMPLDAVWWL